MRTLVVYSGRTEVGRLEEGDDIWAFEYSSAWQESGQSFDLSPALPRGKARHVDGSTHRPVQWFFDNLLPEEMLRQAIAKEACIRDHDDAFALLEYLGAESAGSLTLLPVGTPLPQEFSFRPLPDSELSQRIANLPRYSLSNGAPKKMSLAGAQHKLLVVLKKSELFEPEGATPSTWILKPDHPDYEAYPASSFNEYLTMRLARAARLAVPTVELRYVPQPVYLVERFDRITHRAALSEGGEREPAPIERRHIVDACQLLNKARTFKHTGATLQTLNDIINAVTNKAAARTALFRWLVFNFLASNDDCHLKNLSFFMERDGSVTLAPHYDLLCTGAYHTRAFANEHALWPDLPMAIAFPECTRFGDVRIGHVTQAAQALGLTPSMGTRILSEVHRGMSRELERIRHEHQQKNGVFSNASDSTHAQETRFLAVFRSLTFLDMSRQLGL